jgi:hypothetical protein
MAFGTPAIGPATIDPAGERSVETVIREFADADGTLPREAMQWALDHWEVAGPHFVELLNEYAKGETYDGATESALFFVIHLLAEKRESGVFGALCRLIGDDDTCDTILGGDVITTTLNGVLICTYDGNLAPLKSLIESTKADEFVRAAALEAMCYLARTGAIADDEMRRYLLHLRADMRPHAHSFVWTAWALVVANLGYEDLSREVKRLFSMGFISQIDMSMDYYMRRLSGTLDDPDRMAGFAAGEVGPFTDAIGTFSTWYGFSDQRKRDEAERSARKNVAAAAFPTHAIGMPHLNPARHVGRNDPCPCGSGKKFKKCCLQ